MTDSLALKYRPATFQDMVGQRPVRLVLQQMVKQGSLPASLIFSGVRGTGKTTAGRILAAALNCEKSPEGPCGQCPSCKEIAKSTSPDVLEIDAASNGLVADIRSLREQVLYQVGGAYRVVLLDEAHMITREGFNALLKTLEEPPPNTVFILLTTESGRILDTVQSRSMKFEFLRISVAEIVDRLQFISTQEHLEAEPDLLLAIAERAEGGMRDAVMTLDQVSRVKVKTAAQLEKLLGESDFSPQLLGALLQEDLATVFSVVDDQLTRSGDAQGVSTALVALLRDLAIIQSGGQTSYQGQKLQVRQGLAAQVKPDRLFASLRVLWDLKTKIRITEDSRTSLDLALVMVQEALLGSRSQDRAKPQTSEPMSLAALREASVRQ